MAFKVAFIAHAPDAKEGEQECVVSTQKYNLFVRVVSNQSQAVEVSKKLVAEEGIHSILLCPGFTNKDVSGIGEAVGGKVGVYVARGDGPSQKISREVMLKEGWFTK